MGCAESTDALTIPWQCYDSQFFPQPPSLDQKFERIIVDGYLDRIKGFDNVLAWTKMARFFTNIGGQILIHVDKESMFNQQNLLQLLDEAGFTQCKAFSSKVVFGYNV
jgi:hypothetical protein